MTAKMLTATAALRTGCWRSSRRRRKSDYQKVILTEKSWPIFYHLSPERENILDWYEWKDDASVFEVGAGCGAISGVLCRNAKRVVANDLSKRRSTINAYKNQDASNLEIMVGNFNVVAEKMEERFDYVTLIGVLGMQKAILERIIRIRNIWKRSIVS